VPVARIFARTEVLMGATVRRGLGNGGGMYIGEASTLRLLLVGGGAAAIGIAGLAKMRRHGNQMASRVVLGRRGRGPRR